ERHVISVLPQAHDVEPATDLGTELARPVLEDLLDARLRNRQEPRAFESAKIEGDAAEVGGPGELGRSFVRLKSIEQPARVEHVDRAATRAQRLGCGGGLVEPLEHDGMGAAQPELAGEHQPGRPSSDYDDLIAAHGVLPGATRPSKSSPRTRSAN